MALSSSSRLDCEIVVPLTLAAGVVAEPQAEIPSAAAATPATNGTRNRFIRSSDATGRWALGCRGRLFRHALLQEVGKNHRLIGVTWERHHQLADVLLVDRVGHS